MLKRCLLVCLGLLIVGCSMSNREGPDVTCGDLDSGATNACADGIIASCPDGVHVTYLVCTEDAGGEAAADLCDATFQDKGAYRCSEDADAYPTGPAELVIDSVEVTEGSHSDGTRGDGQVNPGDEVSVSVDVINNGPSDAEGVIVARVATTIGSVSVSSCQTTSTGCTVKSDGCDCSGAGAFDVSVGSAYSRFLRVQGTVGDASVTFEVLLRDRAGREWTDTFEIEVTP